MDFPQEITLDLNSNTAYTTIGAKQGDAFTREIIAHITANGIPWTIPTNVVAMYRVRKPDGTAVWNEAIINNNTVVITLTEETLAVAGRAYADIVFYTNITKAEILSTVSFIIIIMSSPNIAKEVASSNEFGYIQQVVDDANTILHESEAWAVGTKQGVPVTAPGFSYEITTGDNFTCTIDEDTFRNYIRGEANIRTEVDPGGTTHWSLNYGGALNGWSLQTEGIAPIVVEPSNVGLTIESGLPSAGSVIRVNVTENDTQWRNNSKYWADRARISKESIENLTVKVTKTLAAGASASVSSTSVGMVTKGSCTTGYSGITVNKTTFGNKVDHKIRDYKFSYNSGWKLDGKPVTLSAYGISNAPSSSTKIGDYFTITYNVHRSLGFQLPCGPTGPVGVSSVTASAEQLGAGASPAVSVSLSSAKLHFNFGIPAAEGQGAASVDGEVPTGTTRDIKLDAVRAIQSQALTTKQKGYVRDTLGVVPTTFKINGVALGTVSISLTPTNIGAVPTSRTINGKALNSNITLTASNVNAIPTTFKINGVTLGSGSSTALTPANIGAVPTTFKINGVTLGASSTSLTPANIGAVPTTFKINGVTLGATSTSLTAANVGAVPTSRTINGKALSGNLVLSTVFTNVTVASASWASNTAYSAAGFGYRAKVSGLTGVTADMIPSVVFNLTDSMSGIYAPIAATTTNGVYIYASEKPKAQITIPTIVCIAK